jgi:hypothetical protein
MHDGKVTKFNMVRGAYMEQETRNKTAALHDTKNDVDLAYDTGVKELLTSKRNFKVMVATHNTHSIENYLLHSILCTTDGNGKSTRPLTKHVGIRPLWESTRNSAVLTKKTV